ncbi:MAG: hypothetical protein PVH82_13975 [Desulfobacteraceae bacterium]
MKRRAILIVLFLSIVATAMLTIKQKSMFLTEAEAAERIAVMEAREKVMKGQAMLVCAYDSDEKFEKMRLQGAIPLSKFKDKSKDIDKDEMIIFYCA